MRPEGQMLAAWITLSAFRDGPTTVARIEVPLRACDPMDEVSLALHRMNVAPGAADVAPGDQMAGIDRSAVGRT